MSLDHDAIRKAYPEAIRIDDSTGAIDKDGKSISLDQSKIDTARKEIDAEFAATEYQRLRTGITGKVSDEIYPSVGDQLDLLYKDIIAGTLTSSGNFATAIKTIKDKYPKP